MKKKLKVILVPDKQQHQAERLQGTRVFDYLVKISKSKPLLHLLFTSTFNVVNKVDYEVIENGVKNEVVVEDGISLSYLGKVYVSKFKLIKKLDESVYEIRLDNRFEKEEADTHYRFFFFCEEGENLGFANVFCCLYDYQIKWLKSKRSTYTNIRQSGNVITNGKIEDGKFLKEFYSGNSDKFKIYLN